VGGEEEEAAVLQQLVVALLTGDLLVQGQAAAPTAVVQVETLLVSLYTESEQFVSDKHRLNMELDLRGLFGLLCTAVLIG
jgi:hypothetical protein